MKRYYHIIQSVVDENTTAARFAFEPELSVDSLSDIRQRSEAADLVAKVSEAHVPLIE